MLNLNIIVPQDRTRAKVIFTGHHHALWEETNCPFKHTHMDVQNEALYIFPTQKCRCEGDYGRIIGAQNFFHVSELKCPAPPGRGEVVKMDVRIAKNMSPLDQMQNLLAAKMEGVNSLIATRMASENAPRIPEVTAHLVGAGGKRLRPMLTLASAHLFGYDGEDDQKLAATVEFIHTATLLHDDVVDESAQRRGRPTANLLWDNKSSVLVGDYLFSRSFQLMVECGSLQILDILANASAVIAEGEVLQLSAAQDLNTDEAIYTKVIRGKTAALFSAATEVGGIVAGATEAQVKALQTYGDALGMSFQIVDDLLDYGGATTDLGKNIGDDFRERKMSLPVILAVAKADEAERAFWSKVIEKGHQQEGDLEHALELIAKHGILDETRQKALDWASQAKTALSPLPESEMKEVMADLADFVVSRVT